eukprot:2010670-Amphidinium_carterae.1
MPTLLRTPLGVIPDAIGHVSTKISEYPTQGVVAGSRNGELHFDGCAHVPGVKSEAMASQQETQDWVGLGIRTSSSCVCQR